MVEQRYRAVLEVLDEGVSVTEVPAGTGWCGRRSVRGCGGTRLRDEEADAVESSARDSLGE